MGCSIALSGLGHALPSQLLTSNELAARFGLSGRWIVQRTGIEQRRLLGPDESLAELALRAARQACQQAGVSFQQLGAIIVGTVTHDLRTPSLAAYLHGRLGAQNCPAFDVSAASSGYLYALSIARSMLLSTCTQPILVAGVDAPSCLVDWHDRDTAIVFGDGAGASVVSSCASASDRPSDHHELVAIETQAAGQGYDALMAPDPAAGRTGLRMDGRRVFLAAVRTMSEVALRLLQKHGLQREQIAAVYAHQAGSRLLDALSRRTGIARDRFDETLVELGNTSAASIPIGLSCAHQRGALRPGDWALLISFGAGYTSGAALVRW